MKFFCFYLYCNEIDSHPCKRYLHTQTKEFNSEKNWKKTNNWKIDSTTKTTRHCFKNFHYCSLVGGAGGGGDGAGRFNAHRHCWSCSWFPNDYFITYIFKLSTRLQHTLTLINDSSKLINMNRRTEPSIPSTGLCFMCTKQSQFDLMYSDDLDTTFLNIMVTRSGLEHLELLSEWNFAE